MPRTKVGISLVIVWIATLCVSPGTSRDVDRQSRSVEPTSSSLKNDTVGDCTKCIAPLIFRDPRNLDVHVGERASFKCLVRGSPPLDIVWMKNDVPVASLQHNNMFVKQIKEGSRLRIRAASIEDAGIYKCMVLNSFGTDMSTARLRVSSKRREKDHVDILPSDTQNEEQVAASTSSLNPASMPPTGYCVPYTGKVCRDIMDRKRVIYISSQNKQSNVEKKLDIAFGVINKYKEMSPRCKPYVLPLVCHYMFPYCEQDSGQPKPLPLCYNECMMLQNDVCRKEYIIAKREDMIGDVLLPDCESLPKPDTPEGKNCIDLGVRRPIPVRRVHHKGDKCFRGSGESYRGNTSVTESGLTCQQWNSSWPHFHLFTEEGSDYPELLGGHNYCRNPGGNRLRPWCFTTDPQVKFDYCDIQRCEELPSIEVVSILYTVIPCLIFALALSSIIIFVSWHRQKQNLFRSNQPSIPLNTVVTRAPAKSTSEFLLESLHTIQTLGEGEFGTIHCGAVTRLVENQALKTYVTICRLHADISSKTKATFLRHEACWAKFSHPNILCILGIFKQENPMCLLYQPIEEGNLHQYLRRHSPSDSAEQEVLDFKELLSIATQIASGMVYLSSHNYVHGDLAARNCMVGTDQVIKIADFALTRVGYDHDYYRLNGDQPPLPVRWMSPEALFTGTLTVQSDLWSFGIVLWEIFSYGLQPHHGFTNAQVIDHLRQYEILPRPCRCPPQLHDLMKDCWQQDPTLRPRFRELCKSLSVWRVYLEKGQVTI